MHPFGQPSICVVQLSFTALRCQTWRKAFWPREMWGVRTAKNYGCPSNRHGISEILDVSKLSEKLSTKSRDLAGHFVKSSIRKTVSFQHSTCMMFAILPVSLHMIPILTQQDKNEEWRHHHSLIWSQQHPYPRSGASEVMPAGTKETVTCLVRQAFQDTLATSTELK